MVSSNSLGSTGAIANSSDRGDASASSSTDGIEGKPDARGDVMPKVSSKADEGLIDVMANSVPRGVSATWCEVLTVVGKSR